MLHGTLYVDLICCHTWHVMEPVEALCRYLGPRLELAYAVYPLVRQGRGQVPFGRGLYRLSTPD